MGRRAFLSRMGKMALLPLLAPGIEAQSPQRSLRIMMKSSWGSDDPTKAGFVFAHALALSEAGNEVQIFLLGEAVVLMRKVVAESVTPVGWPVVAQTLGKLVERHVPIYACGACSRARGVTEAELSTYGAKFGSPAIFVSLVRWADHVITE